MLDEANRAQAYAWFADVVASQWKHDERPVVFVPVPGSKATTIATVKEGPTHRLAVAVSQRIPGSFAIPLLCWAQPIPSASKEGGSRDPRILYPLLHTVTHTSVPDQARVFLVDDVLTSGGHIRACEAVLRNVHSIHVEGALCLARTVEVEEERALETRTTDYERFQPVDDQSPW